MTTENTISPELFDRIARLREQLANSRDVWELVGELIRIDADYQAAMATADDERFADAMRTTGYNDLIDLVRIVGHVLDSLGAGRTTAEHLAGLRDSRPAWFSPEVVGPDVAEWFAQRV